MARKLRPRKGTTLQNNAYTGALAEVTIDTTKNTIVIHDGVTTGGHPLPTTADLIEASLGVYLLQSRKKTAPNATVPVHVLTAVGTETDIDVALVPKGVGAVLAALPDSTIVGGNKRGIRAVDWQQERDAATQVAAGDYSVIGGGLRNTIAATSATIGGGSSNTVNSESSYGVVGGGYGCSIVSGSYAVVAGGDGCNATGTCASVGGGRYSSAGGTYATVSGGYYNATTNGYDHQTIGGGVSNVVSAESGTVGGGRINEVYGKWGTIPGGNGNTIYGVGSVALGMFAGGTSTLTGAKYFSSGSPQGSITGELQTVEITPWGKSTSATPVTITTLGSVVVGVTNSYALPNKSLAKINGTVMVRNNTVAANFAIFEFSAYLNRDTTAASAAAIVPIVITPIASGGTGATWALAVNVNTTLGGIEIIGTGTAETLTWFGNVKIFESRIW